MELINVKRSYVRIMHVGSVTTSIFFFCTLNIPAILPNLEKLNIEILKDENIVDISTYAMFESDF